MIIINVEWNLYYGMITYRLLLGGVKQAPPPPPPHTSDMTFHPHYANVYVLISESAIALSTYVGMTYDLPYKIKLDFQVNIAMCNSYHAGEFLRLNDSTRKHTLFHGFLFS